MKIMCKKDNFKYTINRMPACNGRFTFDATSWWRNGGISPAENIVRNCTLLPRMKCSESG